MREVLRAGFRRVQSLLFAEGADRQAILLDALAIAKSAEIPMRQAPRQELDAISADHQGVLAQVDPYPYVALDEILSLADDLQEPPFILILDSVQDPQNLGALVRTAEAVGVHGLVLPPRRSAHITPAVVRASSGATEYMRVTIQNLAQAIKALKERDTWIVGMERSEEAQAYNRLDLRGGIGLVIGSEGSGMRKLVRESCDFLACLPMRGKVESLNAAVAGSIMLYEIWRARNYLA